MRRHLLPISILLAVILLSGPSANARTDDSLVTWPYFILPPMFMEIDGTVRGYGVELQDMLQKQLPEYRHTRIAASPKRILSDITDHGQCIAAGVLKNAKREKFMQFGTVPCRLAVGSMVAIRARDRDRLAPTGKASLKGLLSTPDLIFGYMPRVDYGRMQPFLNKYIHRARTVALPNTQGIRHMFTMLIKGRVDWTVFDPTATAYLVNQMGIGDQIAIVPALEAEPEFTPGYMAGPRDAWGRHMLYRIDEILAREIVSGRLHDLLATWIPQDLRPDFDRHYKQLMQKPAQAFLDANANEPAE